MSKTKFTPGPWKLHPNNDYIFSFKSLDDWDNPRPICSPAVIYKENEENEANARLIAAAPELYDAVKELLYALQDDENWRTSGVYEDAEAALAKARGEA